MLFLCVRDIYQHVIDTLKDIALAKSFCQDYGQIICTLMSTVYNDFMQKKHFKGKNCSLHKFNLKRLNLANLKIC